MASNDALPRPGINPESLNANATGPLFNMESMATSLPIASPSLDNLDPLSTMQSMVSALPSITSNTSAGISATCSVPRGQFELFPNLATELRVDIWELVANQPRLVHWRPGGQAHPAMLAVNAEARETGLRYYTLCFNMLRRNQFYAFYVNMKVDTVYWKQMLPNLTRMRETPPYPVPLTMGAGAPPGPGWNVRYWSRSLKRLCINIEEVAAAPRRGGSHPRLQDIWQKLRNQCPDLEELIIVIPRNGQNLVGLQDLIGLPGGSVNLQYMAMMARIKAEFGEVRDTEGLPKCVLKFQTI
ncbi:hypothetical protein EG329_014153 [Mollisiaceae sp. DMI_Dod_QoI]|nr:hypothetical protein EG329_014153 [Helotiales sp. DMI_Dod_QoI]